MVKEVCPERNLFVRTITSAFFGLALSASAFALASTPVSAVEAPGGITTIEKGGITKVDDRDREGRERCERVRRECRERHGDHDREYRECTEREHC
jgi:hypothetical protein